MALRAVLFSAIACIISAQHDDHFEEVLGAAVNFTLRWKPNAEQKTVHMCISANGNSSQYIGLGFSEAEHGMNHSDIVVAFIGSDGKPTVNTMFADEFPGAKGGYPGGKSTLTISKAEFRSEGDRLEACFEREFASGHYPLVDGGRVIWAVGPVVSGAISYHGADGHDDTGKSQAHRSDECNPINWISGGKVCKSSEYCCPDAGHCLTPTKTSCAADASVCSTGQVCCPLTKVCVTPGSTCITPCSDLGSYCCPDAKHCLTPVNPGKFCTGPGTQGSCATGEVCCPLTNECVKVGAACSPP